MRLLVPVSANVSTAPSAAPPALLMAMLPEPPPATLTLAALRGNTCHGRCTVSVASAIVTYPSNSALVSVGPSPPREPPSDAVDGAAASHGHAGRLAALSCNLSTKSFEPLPGTVTVAGADSVTAPLAASSANRKEVLIVNVRLFAA